MSDCPPSSRVNFDIKKKKNKLSWFKGPVRLLVCFIGMLNFVTRIKNVDQRRHKLIKENQYNQIKISAIQLEFSLVLETQPPFDQEH